MFTLFSFYRSKEWESLRDQLKLERMNDCGEIICGHCGKPILKKYDCICHHKTFLTEQNVNDWDISLNPDNIELVHHKCHNEIHNRFGIFNRHIYIVYGSPCSGKTKFVNDNATKDDLIIDIDKIFDAINTSKSNRLYNNVMMVYRDLIDMVRTRNGKWVNAWIVRGFPSKAERERAANDLDGELIYIDTPKEICLERSQLKGDKYYEIVEDWWRKYRE